MKKSAIELEFIEIIKLFRLGVAIHDRGVLIGLIMSFVPIPIISFVGLIIGLFNLRLIKLHKLDEAESLLIKKGIIISIVNTIVFAFIYCYIIFYMYKTVFSRNFYPVKLISNLSEYIGLLLSSSKSISYLII